MSFHRSAEAERDAFNSGLESSLFDEIGFEECNSTMTGRCSLFRWIKDEFWTSSILLSNSSSSFISFSSSIDSLLLSDRLDLCSLYG